MIRPRALAIWLLLGAAFVAFGASVLQFSSGRAWHLARVMASREMPRAQTVSLIEVSRDAQGRTVKSRTIEASRADGAVAMVRQSLNPETSELLSEERQLHFPDRLVIQASPSAGLKMTKRASVQTYKLMYIGMRRDPRSNCLFNLAGYDLREEMGEAFLGAEEVAGLATSHVRDRHGDLQVDQWYAPSHGCALIRQIVRYPKLPTGSASGESVKTLEYLKVGEPDPAYFETYESYREVPPSLYHAAVSGGKCKNPELDGIEDSAYYAHRP